MQVAASIFKAYDIRGIVGQTLDEVMAEHLTAHSAFAILNHILAVKPAGGFYTASQLMGADFVLGLPGVQLHG